MAVEDGSVCFANDFPFLKCFVTMSFSSMNSSNIIVEIKHLLNENKEIYLLGLNVMEIWNVCNSREEVTEVIDKYFDILVNILEEQNK